MPHNWKYTNGIEKQKSGSKTYTRYFHISKCTFCGCSHKWLGHVPKRISKKDKAEHDQLINNAVGNECIKVNIEIEYIEPK